VAVTRNVRLRLQAENASRQAFRSFGGDLRWVATHVNDATMRMRALGFQMAAVGTIFTGAGAGMIGAVAALTNETAQFNRELVMAQTQADDTRIQLEQLQGITRDLATEVPADMAEMPKTLFELFSTLHPTLEETPVLLESISKASIAGNTEMAQTGRAALNVLNAWGMEAERIDDVLDQQFRTVQRGTMQHEEYVQNIGQMIPAARSAGQEIDTMNGALAFLTRLGLRPSMAATSTARAFELLARPRVGDELERIGVEVQDSEGRFRQFTDVIQDMSDQFEGMTEPEIFEQFDEIFRGQGFRIQARRFLQLAVENAEMFGDIVRDVGDDALPGMEERYEMVADTVSAQLDLLRNNFQVLRQEMGDDFVPTMRTVVESFETGVDALRDWNNQSEISISQALAVAGALSVLSGIFLKIAGSALVVKANATMAGVKLSTFLGKGSAAMIGVTALAAGFVYLFTQSEQFRSILATLGNGLQEFVTNGSGAERTLLLIGSAAMFAAMRFRKVNSFAVTTAARIETSMARAVQGTRNFIASTQNARASIASYTQQYNTFASRREAADRRMQASRAWLSRQTQYYNALEQQGLRGVITSEQNRAAAAQASAATIRSARSQKAAATRGLTALNAQYATELAHVNRYLAPMIGHTTRLTATKYAFASAMHAARGAAVALWGMIKSIAPWLALAGAISLVVGGLYSAGQAKRRVAQDAQQVSQALGNNIEDFTDLAQIQENLADVTQDLVRNNEDLNNALHTVIEESNEFDDEFFGDFVDSAQGGGEALEDLYARWRELNAEIEAAREGAGPQAGARTRSVIADLEDEREAIAEAIDGHRELERSLERGVREWTQNERGSEGFRESLVELIDLMESGKIPSIGDIVEMDGDEVEIEDLETLNEWVEYQARKMPHVAGHWSDLGGLIGRVVQGAGDMGDVPDPVAMDAETTGLEDELGIAGDAMDDLTERAENLQNAFDNMVDFTRPMEQSLERAGSLASGFSGYMDDILPDDQEFFNTFEGFSNALENYAEEQQEYFENLRELADIGGSELVAFLQEMGDQGPAAAAMLLDQSEGDIREFADLVRSSMGDSEAAVDSWTDSLTASPEQIREGFQEQAEAIENFVDNLETLAARGAPQEIIDELIDMGPEGAMFAEGFADASSDELNKAFDELEGIIAAREGDLAVDTDLGLAEIERMAEQKGEEAGRLFKSGINSGIIDLDDDELSLRRLREVYGSVGDELNTLGDEFGNDFAVSIWTALESASDSEIENTGVAIEWLLENEFDTLESLSDERAGELIMTFAATLQEHGIDESSKSVNAIGNQLITEYEGLQSEGESAGNTLGQDFSAGMRAASGSIAAAASEWRVHISSILSEIDSLEAASNRVTPPGSGGGPTGQPYMRNTGGPIPGPNVDRDVVPAMLTPGEFVLRKEAVKKIGLNALSSMNTTGTLPGFRQGGPVGPNMMLRDLDNLFDTGMSYPIEDMVRPGEEGFDFPHEHSPLHRREWWMAEEGVDEFGREITPSTLEEVARNADSATEALKHANLELERQEEIVEQRERADAHQDQLDQIKDAEQDLADAERELAEARKEYAQADEDEKERAADQIERQKDQVKSQEESLEDARQSLKDWERDQEQAARERKAQEILERLEREKTIEQNREQYEFENASIVEQINLLGDRLDAERKFSDEWMQIHEEKQQALEDLNNAQNQIISDLRGVLDAQQELDRIESGAHEARLRLDVLDREEEVADARKKLERIRRGEVNEETQERIDAAREEIEATEKEIEAAEKSVETAEARVALKEAEVARVDQISGDLDNEVAALLKQAEADYYLKQAEEELQDSKSELHEVEKELQEAQEELRKLRKEGQYTAEDEKRAELELIIAKQDAKEATQALKWQELDLKEAKLGVEEASGQLKEGLEDLIDDDSKVSKYFEQLTSDADSALSSLRSLRDEIEKGTSGGSTAPNDNEQGYEGGSGRGTLTPQPHAPGIRSMASGGLVRATTGGILANIGEGHYDEAVVPLPQGARSFAKQIEQISESGGGTTNLEYKPTYNISIAPDADSESVRQAVRQQLKEHDDELIETLRGRGVRVR